MENQQEKTEFVINHLTTSVKKHINKCSLCRDKPYLYGFIEIGNSLVGYALCPTCGQTATIRDIARDVIFSGEIFVPSKN
jgi:hypothetical protein